MTEGRWRIDVARTDDADLIAGVHVRAWQVAYRHLMPAEYLAGLSVERRADAWRGNLADASLTVLVARDAGEVVGFAATSRSRDADAGDDVGELQAIYVEPARWSSGVGRALWLPALASLQSGGHAQVTLWVLAGNERAIRFYERAGFVCDPGVQQSLERGGARLEEHRYRLRLPVQREGA